MIRCCLFSFLLLPLLAQEMRPVSFHKPVRQTESLHFRYIYDADVAPKMPMIRSYCEAAHEIFSQALGHKLSETPVVIVSDRIDHLEGHVQVAPHLTIGLSLNQSFSGFSGLLSQGDMMWLLVVHEMAHVFTLDQGGPAKEQIAALFGRVPLDGEIGLPTVLLNLLTNARSTLTPSWYPEGWATWAETEYTAGGRGRSAFVDAIWRQKVLADELPGPKELGVNPRRWPGGMQPYTLGQAVFENLNRSSKAGEKSLPSQVNKAGSNRLFFFNRASTPITGSSINDIAQAGLAAVDQRQRRNIASLQEQPVTKTPRYSPRTWIVNSPSQLPDGRWVLNANRFDNRRPSLVVFEPSGEAGRVRWTSWSKARTDAASELAVHPDGHVYYTRLDPRGTGEWYRSLYRRSAKGSITRIAKSTRFEQIVIDPTGQFLVAVRSSRSGTAYLTQHPILPDGRLGKGEVRYRPPSPHRLGRPSITAGGDILVPEIGTEQSWIVRMGLDGGITEHVSGVRGMLIDPVEDPASGDIIAAWDDGGVFNLYRFAPGNIKPTRITHTLGALLNPRLSRRGNLVALNLDEDGVYFTSLGQPKTIRQPMPGVRPDRPVNTEPPAIDERPLSPRPYRGVPAMRFDYWVPVADASTDGTIGGLSAHFSDPVDFHRLDLFAGYDTGIEETVGAARYRFGGMRTGLTLEATRQTALYSDLLPRASIDEGVALDDYEEVNSSGRIGLDWLFPRPDSFTLLELGLQASDREAAANTAELADADFETFFTGVDTRTYSGLTVDTTTRYPKSHSRENGRIIHLGADLSTEELGGDLSRQRGLASWSEYVSLPWTDHHVLVLNGSYGLASGDETRQGSFGLGGVSLLQEETFNPIAGGRLGAPLRGYGPNAQVGNELQKAGAAWRFPIYRSFRSGSPTSLLGISQISGEVFYDIARAWNDREGDGEWISSTGAQLNLGLLLLGEFEIVPSIGVAYAPDQDQIRPVDDGDEDEVRGFFTLRAGAAY